MVCLETTFIIDLLKGKTEVLRIINELENANSRVSITTPTLYEVWAGAISTGSKKELIKINELLQSIEVLQLDQDCAREAAAIKNELIKKGSIIQRIDILIAGIAKTHNEKLLTRDGGYANIDGLRIIKY